MSPVLLMKYKVDKYLNVPTVCLRLYNKNMNKIPYLKKRQALSLHIYMYFKLYISGSQPALF